MTNDLKLNCSRAAMTLIRLLRIPVSKSAIDEKIIEHPDYPSLVSISDSFKDWKIENLSIKISKDKLEDIPAPFIAQVEIIILDKEWVKGEIADKTANSLFVVVKSVSKENVVYLDYKNSKRSKTVIREEFNKIWTGVVFLATPEENSGEPEYKISRRKEVFQRSITLGAIMTITVLFFASIYRYVSPINTTSLPYLLLLFLKLFGTIISSILLWYEIDNDNPLVKSVCSTGTKSNCGAILDSKASKLFGVISWSEIGFFYFSGALFIMLSGNLNVTIYHVFAWSNALALPYTIFSVYYQWKIAKQWCVFCLSVQALLILEFSIFLFDRISSYSFEVNIDELVISSSFFLIPILVWFLVKRHLLESRKGRQIKIEVSRLKNNIPIFETLLQKEFPVLPSNGLGISLGNPNGKYSIIKVCNPYCEPCAKAHSILEDILLVNADVHLQIIFKVTNHEYDTRSKPVKHFLSIAATDDPLKLRSVLDAWYSNPIKNYSSFIEKYPLSSEIEDDSIQINQMADWCRKMNVSATPTFFVNGYALPALYNIEDLRYLFST